MRGGIRGAVKSRKQRSRVGYEPHAPAFYGATRASGFTLNAATSILLLHTTVHRVTREPWYGAN